LAAAAGLKTDRGIQVDQFMQTSAGDIFAAGDVAQFLDPVTGKYEQESLWVPARRQGTTAGLSMAGFPEPYSKGLALNVTRLAGLTTTIMGRLGGTRDADTVSILHGDSETWREGAPGAVATQLTSDYTHVRLIVGQQFLQGALIMGDQTLSAPLQGLIANQVDILSIRDALLAAGAPVGKLLTDLWETKKGEYGTQRQY
jgi:NADPH-dependent 2,4-dienoyl-CoA reductase/sulfur reductase-like enzyme